MRPAAHGHDQARLLGQWDEILGRHQPVPAVSPAHQGLEARDPSAAELDQRLEKELEFALVQGLLDLLFVFQLGDRAARAGIGEFLARQAGFGRLVGTNFPAAHLVQEVAVAGERDPEDECDDLVRLAEAVQDLVRGDDPDHRVGAGPRSAQAFGAIDERHFPEQLARPQLAHRRALFAQGNDDLDLALVDDIRAIAHIAVTEDFRAGAEVPPEKVVVHV